MALSSRDQFEIRAFIIFGCLSHRSNGFWRQALAVAASQLKGSSELIPKALRPNFLFSWQVFVSKLDSTYAARHSEIEKISLHTEGAIWKTESVPCSSMVKNAVSH